MEGSSGINLVVVKEPSWLCLICDVLSVPGVSVVPAVIGWQNPGQPVGTGSWGGKGVAVTQSSNPIQPLKEEELGEDMPGLI